MGLSNPCSLHGATLCLVWDQSRREVTSGTCAEPVVPGEQLVPLSWHIQGKQGFSSCLQEGSSLSAAGNTLSFTCWHGWELCLLKIKTHLMLKMLCKGEAGDGQSTLPLLDKLPFSSTSLLQQALNTRGAAALSVLGRRRRSFSEHPALRASLPGLL